mgnify:CR=1 FL=1
MTIVDSSYAIMAGFNYVARKNNIPEVDHDKVMKYIACPINEYCKNLLGDFKPEWIQMYRDNNAEYERKLIKPFDDTIPTLEKLKSMGIILAMASNRELPSRVCERTGLNKYFNLIVGALEPFGKIPYKPDPVMLNKILEYFKISRENAIYIGDAEIDIKTAINSNMRGIGITKGNLTAEEFIKIGAWKSINNLSELIEIVNSENI